MLSAPGGIRGGCSPGQSLIGSLRGMLDEVATLSFFFFPVSLEFQKSSSSTAVLGCLFFSLKVRRLIFFFLSVSDSTLSEASQLATIQ